MFVVVFVSPACRAFCAALIFASRLLTIPGLSIQPSCSACSLYDSMVLRVESNKVQVHRKKPVIVKYLKTDAACRDIDLSKQIAEYLQEFIGDKDALLFETRNGTPYLHHNLEDRWLTSRLSARDWMKTVWGSTLFADSARRGCAQAVSRRHQQFLDGPQAEDDVRTLFPHGRRTGTETPRNGNSRCRVRDSCLCCSKMLQNLGRTRS
jgi:hypothetical protein